MHDISMTIQYLGRVGSNQAISFMTGAQPNKDSKFIDEETKRKLTESGVISGGYPNLSRIMQERTKDGNIPSDLDTFYTPAVLRKAGVKNGENTMSADLLFREVLHTEEITTDQT